MDAFEQAELPVRQPVRSGGVVVTGLVEPLSARELEVLRLLAAGGSGRRRPATGRQDSTAQSTFG